jgi:D-alanyl-D-alanine carboxypeptidase (penicillin-binding protein 5/6)
VLTIPIVRQIVALQSATLPGGRVLHTWDDLLGRFPGLLGGKTGHTDAAGWCEVAAATSRGSTVYATVLGGSSRASRNDDLATALTWGLSRFRVVDAVAPGKAYATVALPYGRAPLAAVATGRLRLAVRVDERLVEKIVVPTSASLPVRAGQPLGRVEIWRDGRLAGERPLVAARAVTRPGLAGRLRWYARRTLHHLGSMLTP